MIQLGYRGKIAVVLVGMSFSLNHVAYGQNLPKGEELLDKYVAATGGKEAYEKCKNRLIKGTMEFAGAGIKGELTIYQTRPNKMYLEVNLQGIGKIEQGTDGQTVWERNAITGENYETIWGKRGIKESDEPLDEDDDDDDVDDDELDAEDFLEEND